MKLKYYVRGLGIGIVFATIMCVISVKVKGNTMSDSEIIERARELGMVMEYETDIFKNPSESESQSSNEETNSSKEDNKDTASSEPSQQESASESSQPESSNSDETKETEPTSQSEVVTQPSSEPQTDVIHNISIEVISGMDSGKVASLLYSAGLIDDATAFNNYLVNNNYANNIRTGNYTIQEGSSYETIANILVGR